MKKSRNSYEYDYVQVEKEFGIVFDRSRKISQFGGLSPLIAFLKKGHFRERLTAEFGSEKARTMLQLLLGIVAGADRMIGAARAGQDPIIRSYLGNPVGEAQLARDFKAFTKVELERLHEWVTSIAILELVRDIPREEALVFDIDATSVERFGEQAGVEHGYIDKNVIEACYQYQFFRLHNLNTFLYGTIRAGSTHSQNGICGYLERFLPAFEKRWKTVWRMDSGYFNERAFDIFSENDATFYVKAPMSDSRQTAAASPSLVWHTDPKDPDTQYASRNTYTAKGTLWREIYKRSRIRAVQLSLIESVQYRYACLATNDLLIEERAAFEFYNGRANIENNLRELKHDYALGSIVTEGFDANDAITQVTLLAYLLMQHFKRSLLPPEMLKRKLSTLRWEVFNIPGRLLSAARKKFVRIYNIFHDEKFYARLLYKLKHLRSWVLAPPQTI